MKKQQEKGKVVMRSKLASIVLLVTLLAFVKAVHAQAPGLINKNDEEMREYYELLEKQKEERERKDEAVVEVPETPVDPKADAGARKIRVTRFEVSSSSVLRSEQITGITSKYLDREVDINELMAMVNEINQLYSKEAKIVARAVLPKQKVSDGVVKIQLIEARLGKVLLEDNTHTKESYIQDRIIMPSGSLIHVDQLSSELIAFNRWNDLKLKASLAPGEQYGTSNVVLKAKEADKYRLNVFADNAGRDTVGKNRFGLSAQMTSLAGVQDRLNLGTTFSEGSDSIWGSYEIPINTSGTRFGVSYTEGDIEIVQGALVPLNVTGDSKNMGVSLVQAVKATATFDWSANIGMMRKESASYFDGVNLVNTEALDATMGMNFRFYDAKGTWINTHAATMGDAGNGRPGYVIYKGSLIRIQYFESGLSLLFRSSVQSSNQEDLPSFNQMIVGGTASVRGYSEGLVAGDSGYTVSAELSQSINADADWITSFNISAFVDAGEATPFRGNDEPRSRSRDKLSSVGFGLDASMVGDVSVKLSFAMPLQNEEFYDQDQASISAMIKWRAF